MCENGGRGCGKGSCVCANGVCDDENGFYEDGDIDVDFHVDFPPGSSCWLKGENDFPKHCIVKSVLAITTLREDSISNQLDYVVCDSDGDTFAVRPDQLIDVAEAEKIALDYINKEFPI